MAVCFNRRVAASHFLGRARSATSYFPSFSDPWRRSSHITRIRITDSRHLARMASSATAAMSLPRLPIFEALAAHDPQSPVVIHAGSGRRFTYADLLHDVAVARQALVTATGAPTLEGERIAFLVENSYDYVVTFLSIIAAHSIALPLSPAFPPHELQYIMNHSQAAVLLASKKFATKAQEVLNEGLETPPRYIQLEKRMESSEPVKIIWDGPVEGKGGMMLYTSGTTNRPKGVLLPESALTAQARSLQTAWKYTSRDHLLHVLPLHHIHGTVNAILTPLFAGSVIEFMFPFHPTLVWERFAAPFMPGNPTREPITFFTVVPTVYNRLLSTHADLSPEVQAAAKKAISPENLRLNISGSAALPTPTKKAWSDLSNGNILLERYGMTEVGMALSCTLANADRIDGSVGWPLPSVQVRLVDTDTNEVILPGEEIGKDGRERDGEIQLRGPTLFQEYWRNKEATDAEHVESDDGQGRWFKTGDVAVRRAQLSAAEEWATGWAYFIRGRKSADIIKSGGEKVSALEVERELLSLPQVADAAVLAIGSGKWGQKVGVILVLRSGAENTGLKGKSWGPMDMRRALRDRLATYKIPQVMKVVDEIPKNAMGKVNKKQLVKELFVDETSGDEGYL